MPGSTTTTHRAPRVAAPGRAPRSARSVEVARAAAVVAAGRGALVWTAEPGTGKSATLDAVVEELEALPEVRLLRATSPGAWGAHALRTLVAHVQRDAPAIAVPATLSEPSDDPLDAQTAALALSAYLAQAYPERTVVVAVDDLDLVEERSRGVLLELVGLRRHGVVLLGTAAPGAATSLAHPVEVRTVRPLAAADALELLWTRGRVPVAPRVAALLARDLRGNATAIAQVAAELTPDELRGWSALPDPLPVPPVVRDLLGQEVDQLPATQRHVLLVAAVAVVHRTDVLLDACGLTMAELAAGGAARHLELVASRYRFADPRVRALVHADASVSERTAAHLALAAAHAAAGEERAAGWHRALATLEGDPRLGPPLVAVASEHLRAGCATTAYAVAREAASHATGETRREACAVASRAALRAGYVHDARTWVRRALRGADAATSARLLREHVEAITLSEGQVPVDAVHRALAHAERLLAAPVDPAGDVDAVLAAPVGPAGDVDAVLAGVVRGLASAASLHAERGEGPHAREALAAAERVAEAVVRRDTQGRRAAAMRSEVDQARGWCALYGVGVPARPDAVTGPADVLAAPTRDGDSDAFALVAHALGAVLDHGDPPPGWELTCALAELAPVNGGATWADDGSAPACTPVGESYLRVAAALATAWAGELTDARTALLDAAFAGPVELVLGGFGTALARRLDIVVTGQVGTVAETLGEVTPGHTARAARHGVLVDRALVAVFTHRYAHAATLLELGDEREAFDDARMLPMPDVDEVCAWERARRPAAAQDARDRLHRRLGRGNGEHGEAALVRADVLVATDARLDDAVQAALDVARRVRSPFERARTELAVGRALAVHGRADDAARHLLSATELFEESGALAWAELAHDDLAELAPAALVGEEPWEDAAFVAGLEERPVREPAAREGAGREGSQGDGAGAGPARTEERAGETAQAGEPSFADLRERWADLLTDRELDVAEHVVEGASNKEVAERLFVSVRTVEVHLGRVFRKLGVRSRVELAVLAHRGGRDGGARDGVREIP